MRGGGKRDACTSAARQSQRPSHASYMHVVRHQTETAKSPAQAADAADVHAAALVSCIRQASNNFLTPYTRTPFALYTPVQNQTKSCRQTRVEPWVPWVDPQGSFSARQRWGARKRGLGRAFPVLSPQTRQKVKSSGIAVGESPNAHSACSTSPQDARILPPGKKGCSSTQIDAAPMAKTAPCTKSCDSPALGPARSRLVCYMDPFLLRPCQALAHRPTTPLRHPPYNRREGRLQHPFSIGVKKAHHQHVRPARPMACIATCLTSHLTRLAPLR